MPSAARVEHFSAGRNTDRSTPLGITRACSIAGASIDCSTLSRSHREGVATIDPASRVDVTLADPVVRRGVPANRRLDGEVRTVAAAGLPSLAIERVRAMSAEGPGVVKRPHRRRLPAEPGQGSQVEIAAVQIVTVEKIRALRRQIEQSIRAGKLEILAAHAQVHKRARMRPQSKRPIETAPSLAGKPSRHLARVGSEAPDIHSRDREPGRRLESGRHRDRLQSAGRPPATPSNREPDSLARGCWPPTRRRRPPQRSPPAGCAATARPLPMPCPLSRSIDLVKLIFADPVQEPEAAGRWDVEIVPCVVR